MRELADVIYPHAKKIVVVLDNLNTHSPASFYETFEPDEARRLAERFEFHFRPKHGSWLNMAEIELGIIIRQCLSRRIVTKAKLEAEVKAWQDDRNPKFVKVDVQNQHCHLVCNPVYTAYHTRPSKDRLTVLDVLRNGRQRLYHLNDEALGYLKHQLHWSKATWYCLQGWVSEESLAEAPFLNRLDTELPGLGQQHRKSLLDTAAIAAYHAEVGCPVVRVLVFDDAPQFNWLTQRMMQCWVHEGHHYKKLSPVIALHRENWMAF